MNNFGVFTTDPYHRIASLLLSPNNLASEREIYDLISTVDKNKLFSVLKGNELVSIVYEEIEQYLDKEQRDYWKIEHDAVEGRISVMFEELSVVGEAFKQKKLKVVALKNGGIAQFKDESYAKHPMGDIDLFVDQSQFKDAHKAIIDCGFTLKFRSEFEEDNFDAALINGATEYYKEIGKFGTMWLELSDRAVSGRWINPDNEPKSKDLIGNSYEGKINGIYILSPEDNLLQVSLHTAKHSYFRAPGFRLHLDVQRIVEACEIDWNLFVRKVEHANAKSSVYFSLLFAKELIGANVPSEVIEKIRPNKVKIKLVYFLLKHFSLYERFEFNRLAFIIFQVLLYDNMRDVFRVALPPKSEIKNRYSTFPFPIGYIIHVLDLVGIRKKFKK
ncbi:nucleotidyltransferase family protein [Vibrio splendidus]